MGEPGVSVSFFCNILDAIIEQYPEFGKSTINEGFRARIARLEKHVQDQIEKIKGEDNAKKP